MMLFCLLTAPRGHGLLDDTGSIVAISMACQQSFVVADASLFMIQHPSSQDRHMFRPSMIASKDGVKTLTKFVLE